QEHLNPTMVRTIRSIFKAMRVRFEPEPDVCPTACFEPDKLEWPRVVRRAFSDPRVPHESTGVEGRRTEEVIRMVWRIEKEISTVVALGVGTRCDENGEDTVVAPILERLGYKLERAKTNIGLGRVSIVQPQAGSREVVHA